MKSLLGTKTQLLASATLLTLGIATPAAAQTQPPSPPANESVSDENSEAIIVTAQKREEVLLEVPQSVTVVGGDTLDRQQATNFQDYLALVPGLSLEGSTPGVTRVTLRGSQHRRRRLDRRASTSTTFRSDRAAGLANGAILSGDFDPFDISRIEVLRGPQGTLYGASSLGGVIKYVTNPPRLNRFEAKAQVGLESTKGSGSLGYNAAGIINVPLGQKAALRVDRIPAQGPGLHRFDRQQSDPQHSDRRGNWPHADQERYQHPQDLWRARLAAVPGHRGFVGSTHRLRPKSQFRRKRRF